MSIVTKGAILIVDDKPANILALENILNREDVTLLTATTGKDALKIILNSEVDLIIMDVQMPEMDGFEVAQILKSNKRTKDIPIIFASAEMKEHKFMMKAFEQGAIDYLYKPLDPEIARAKVAVFLKLQLQKKELIEKNLSLEKSRLLINNCSDIIGVLDNKTLVIEEINPAFTSLLGYTLEETINQPLTSFLSFDDASLFEKYTAQENGHVHFETPIYCKDKSTKWLQWRIVIKYGKWFANARDITEQKITEEELKRSKELAESLLRTQEIFVANVSHEIRTPMNAILGFTTLLERSSLNEEQKEQVDAVKKSGEMLLGIINDILDMSKIESGVITFEEIPFSVRALLDSLKAMLLHKAQEKSIQLKLQLENNIPEIVCGDPTRLSQILLNVAHNAIKFTENGEVSIKVKVKEVGESSLRIIFKIKDTGIGIPENKIEKIFERFEQANVDTTRKFGGTGLGLNIVKNLVSLQNGTINVESNEGLGSVFTIELPFRIVKHPELSKEPTEFSPQSIDKGVKILLVEDNFLNQKLALSVLKSFAFDVTVASNGKKAIEILEHHKFDVILMDLQMPEIDGYTASELIRKDISKDIPIIAMTANAMAGEKEKCHRYGMNDYISKPFKESDLLNKILFYYESNKHITKQVRNLKS